jgi:hypothetical protein
MMEGFDDSDRPRVFAVLELDGRTTRLYVAIAVDPVVLSRRAGLGDRE